MSSRRRSRPIGPIRGPEGEDPPYRARGANHICPQCGRRVAMDHVCSVRIPSHITIGECSAGGASSSSNAAATEAETNLELAEASASQMPAAAGQEEWRADCERVQPRVPCVSPTKPVAVRRTGEGLRQSSAPPDYRELMLARRARPHRDPRVALGHRNWELISASRHSSAHICNKSTHSDSPYNS